MAVKEITEITCDVCGARDLWDWFVFRLFLLNYMDGNDSYVIDMNTDCLPFNVTGFEELCMLNWTNWLEGIIRNA